MGTAHSASLLTTMPRTAPTPTRLVSRAGSLSASSTWEENVDRLWDTVSFTPDLCVSGAIFEPCDPPEKVITQQDGTQTAPVHGLWEGAICSTGSGQEAIDLARERATRALDTSYVSKIEEALWTGGVYAPIIDGTALASTAADDLTPGGPLGVVPAISLLIDELNGLLGDSRGLIHGPQSVVPYLAFYGVLVRNGNQLQIANTDHLFVAGRGYPGTDPDGNAPAAGETWLYGTGPVNVLVSELLIPDPSINRAVNALEVRAERTAAAYFSPCAHLAVNVCLPDPGPDCVTS